MASGSLEAPRWGGMSYCDDPGAKEMRRKKSLLCFWKEGGEPYFEQPGAAAVSDPPTLWAVGGVCARECVD